MHRYSIHRKRLPTARLGSRSSEQPFAQGRFSISSAGLSACSDNLLIFLSGCAAYGLLFKQTRALRSNSVFKAIAMLAKPTKICQRSARTSGEICTLIWEGNGTVQIVCSTSARRNRLTATAWADSPQAQNLRHLRKGRSFLHDLRSPERDTTVQAFGEIFADFSSIAIARDALFEHCVRVCVKSNP